METLVKANKDKSWQGNRACLKFLQCETWTSLFNWALRARTVFLFLSLRTSVHSHKQCRFYICQQKQSRNKRVNKQKLKLALKCREMLFIEHSVLKVQSGDGSLVCACLFEINPLVKHYMNLEETSSSAKQLTRAFFHTSTRFSVSTGFRRTESQSAAILCPQLWFTGLKGRESKGQDFQSCR